MPDSLGAVLSPPFVRLPVELLEEIYVLSETHSLPHVCRSFYVALSSDYTCLRFCTRLFSLDNPRKHPDQKGTCLRDEQTKVLAQEWFTADFAKKIKVAVGYIATSDMIENTVRSKVIPNTY